MSNNKRKNPMSNNKRKLPCGPTRVRKARRPVSDDESSDSNHSDHAPQEPPRSLTPVSDEPMPKLPEVCKSILSICATSNIHFNIHISFILLFQLQNIGLL